jgi:bifunctional DNA-binding transcriptional regulator/antitoxin component of YhaV-PrlF toxin-antitoxin module
MSTLKVTANGQVAIRQDVLKHLGLQPGDTITVEKLSNGRVELTAARPKGDISDVFNFFRRENGASLSIEEIAGQAAEGWAGKR